MIHLNYRLALLSVVISVSSFTAFARAESVENPAYASWAKCKVGTTIQLETTTAVGRAAQKIETTSELKEITDRYCTIDTSIEAAGHTMKMGPQKVEKELTDPAKVKQYQSMEQSTEKTSVTVPAGTFDCKSFATTLPGQGGTITIWFAQDVPGSMVKVEMKKGDEVTTKLELKAIARK